MSQPGEIAERVCGRLELRPSARQLIVGGIGTGKTTQLLVACERLQQRNPEALSTYIDVSKHQDLERIQPGSLLALVGLQLLRVADIAHDEHIFKLFSEWAGGYAVGEIDAFERHYSGEGEPEFEPGIVTPPDDRIDHAVKQYRDELKQFIDQHWAEREMVVFVDSLDRVHDLSIFLTAVNNDLRALSQLGIGVVVVGPLRAIYGLERTLLDHFDHWYRQSTIDIEASAEGHAFLAQVLRQRTDRKILPDAQCHELATLSGGVLRDLIRLAHQAGEEAYLDGAETILPEHIERAASAFGRSLLLGVSSADIDTLYRIQRSGSFVAHSENDFTLLATRRILDYQSHSGADVHYRVHPTIVPLLTRAPDDDIPF